MQLHSVDGDNTPVSKQQAELVTRASLGGKAIVAQIAEISSNLRDHELFNYDRRMCLVEQLVLLLVLGTSIWVLIDAKTIGVKKGQIKGMSDLGPWGWFSVCLLLWIVGFPFYLAKRGEYKRINGK